LSTFTVVRGSFLRSFTDSANGVVTAPPTRSSAVAAVGGTGCWTRGRMMDTTATPIVGSKDTTHLVFLQHYFRGFDYGSDRVADLQIHLLGASSGYDAFDEVLANLNDDVGHDPTELKLRDFALESIPGRKFHSQIINADIGLVQEK
jgi:hypothetical protein